MKTAAMQHQLVGAELLRNNPSWYALGAEQGTGKTWMLLNDAEQQFMDKQIDALFVVAPKGVHVNWIRREAPTHLSVPFVSEFWLSGAGVRHKQRLEKLLRSPEEGALTIFAMNVDAVNTKEGYAYAEKFLRRYSCMMVVDESQRIKNVSAKRSRQVLELGKLAKSRRIASGTLVANTPLDLFGQFEFLRPGLLGTKSYRAFVAEYAELLPQTHALVQEIMSRTRGQIPQVVRRDQNGNMVFRNIEKLRRLMAPWTYRVLKKDCLDLPEKIYKTHYFDLDAAQTRLYKKIRDERSYVRPDGDLDLFNAMTVITKLRQVTSGFIMVDGAADALFSEQHAAPRLSALMDVLEDIDGKVIIWASFREEIAQICKELRSGGEEVVEYHGGTSSDDREQAIEAFQNGSARFFVSNPAAGGTGLTLTAAETAIYYSRSFSLEERLQSEDRNHRIGTRNNVVYIDIVARDTVDERIAVCLQQKNLTAQQVLD